MFCPSDLLSQFVRNAAVIFYSHIFSEILDIHDEKEIPASGANWDSCFSFFTPQNWDIFDLFWIEQTQNNILL